MVRTTGLTSEYKPIEKIEENFYKICWDIQPVTERVFVLNEETGEPEFTGEVIETDYSTWMYEEIKGEHSVNLIKRFILDWYNTQIDNKILKGFVWNNAKIWLSTENQFNYKAAYDLAIQTNGANLPIMFKFGTTENPIYHTFTTLEELTDFYLQAMNYINSQLNEGWAKKDAIDWSVYSIE